MNTSTPLLTVDKCIAGGRGLAPALLKRAATLSLAWDVRQKSRFDGTDSLGRPLAVFLPRGHVARGGDVLVAEDGSLVRMIAAPQPLMLVRACARHGSPFDLTRAAYHLGNRHVALELQPDHLKLEPDHVLADMLRQMHLIVTATEAPFEPEGGAYAAAGHGHGHGHAHEHGHGHHEHDHHHDRTHGHGDAATPADHHAAVTTAATDAPPARKPVSIPVRAASPHVHGPGCDHGHDH